MLKFILWGTEGAHKWSVKIDVQGPFFRMGLEVLKIMRTSINYRVFRGPESSLVNVRFFDSTLLVVNVRFFDSTRIQSASKYMPTPIYITPRKEIEKWKCSHTWLRMIKQTERNWCAASKCCSLVWLSVNRFKTRFEDFLSNTTSFIRLRISEAFE